MSGGQRQRLAAARALLADFPVLVLDEPGEHLDTATADAIVADLLERASGQAILLITHRLAGLDAVDEVIVLDGGRAVERGTHEELLARGGAYAAMWRARVGWLMNWARRFRARQYIRGSLWVLPLVGGAPRGGAGRARRARRQVAAPVRRARLLGVHGQHAADDDRRRDGGVDRVRRDGHRAGRADGDRHVLGPVHAPVVSRPPCSRRCWRCWSARWRSRSRCCAASRADFVPNLGVSVAGRPRGAHRCCCSSSFSTGSCTGCGRWPLRCSSPTTCERDFLPHEAALVTTPDIWLGRVRGSRRAAHAGRPQRPSRARSRRSTSRGSCSGRVSTTGWSWSGTRSATSFPRARC